VRLSSKKIEVSEKIFYGGAMSSRNSAIVDHFIRFWSAMKCQLGILNAHQATPPGPALGKLLNPPPKPRPQKQKPG
jgi:hypothetical protein